MKLELSQRRRWQAKLWAGIFTTAVAIFAYIIFFIIPRPPAGMGFTHVPKGERGIGLGDLASLLAMATTMSAALLAFQELLLRPLLRPGAGPKTTEAVFFSSSICVRVVMAGTLLYHHYGPGRHDAHATGDGAHRLPMAALFYAAYSVDLVQMVGRAGEFTKSYVKMVVPHHWASLLWYTAWLLWLAPSGAGGAPLWNTAVFYLTCCVPVHAFKLFTCYSRSKWSALCVLPVLSVHWLLLLASQSYYFTQCSCSQWGCFYPGSIFMMIGGWGAVLYTMPDRLNSIVLGGSRALGAPITFSDIFPLLLASKAAGAPAAAPVPTAVSGSAGAGNVPAQQAGSGSASAERNSALIPVIECPDEHGHEDDGANSPLPRVELVFKDAKAGGPGPSPAAGGKLAPSPLQTPSLAAGSPAAPVVAQDLQQLQMRRLPAIAASLCAAEAAMRHDVREYAGGLLAQCDSLPLIRASLKRSRA